MLDILFSAPVISSVDQMQLVAERQAMLDEEKSPRRDTDDEFSRSRQRVARG